MDSRILLIALPFVALACGDTLDTTARSNDGGSIAPDDGMSSSSSSGNPPPDADASLPDAATGDAATPDASTGPQLAACSTTPQVLAALTPASSTDQIERIVLGPTHAAFTLGSDTKYQIHAVDLRSGVATTVVAATASLAPVSPTLTILGNEVFYAGQQANSPSQSVLARAPLAGGQQGSVALASALGVHEVAAAPDGTLFLHRNTDRDEIRSTFSSWRPGEAGATALRGEAWPTGPLSTFAGGFFASTSLGTVLAVQTRRTIDQVDIMSRCIVLSNAQAFQGTPDTHSYLVASRNMCTAPREAVLNALSCAYDAEGLVHCSSREDAQYRAESGLDIFDFRRFSDGGLVVGLRTDGEETRPTSRIVVHDAQGDRIVNGTDTTDGSHSLTALGARDECVYWSERSATGVRLMRAHR